MPAHHRAKQSGRRLPSGSAAKRRNRGHDLASNAQVAPRPPRVTTSSAAPSAAPAPSAAALERQLTLVAASKARRNNAHQAECAALFAAATTVAAAITPLAEGTVERAQRKRRRAWQRGTAVMSEPSGASADAQPGRSAEPQQQAMAHHVQEREQQEEEERPEEEHDDEEHAMLAESEVLRSPLTAVTAPPAAPPVTAPPPGPPVTAPLEAPDIVDHLIQNAQDEVSTIPAAPPLIIKLSTPGRDAAPSSDGQARHARARDTRANTSGGGAAHDADAACGSRNSTHCLRAVAACATHFRLQPPSRPPLFSNQPRAHPRVLGDCSPGHCEHAGHGAKHETRSHAGGSRSC